MCSSLYLPKPALTSHILILSSSAGVLMNPKSDTAPDTKEVPKGLLVWREAVGKTETAAQLAMCTYMLETAVAWDKSIMKAVSGVCVRVCVCVCVF